MGCIDTLQLYLKKMQLLASGKAIASKSTDINKQIAATKEQIGKAEYERKRTENLLKENAATQKHGLTIHTPTDGTNKCYIYDSKDTKNLKFDLLGYTIQSIKGDNDKQGFFSLSKNKKQKIQNRITKTFQRFDSLLNTMSYDIAA